MKFKTSLRVIFLSTSFVYIMGCANSASHKVVRTEKIGDTSLSCSQLKTEKRKVQVIINGVEQDKADMTGSDLVDGLLWFPFNVIAKQSNYRSATKAAEERISYLTALELEHRCGADGNAIVNATADRESSRQLQQLNSLYRDGVLTQDEYVEKRTRILDNITPHATIQTSRQAQQKIGQYSYKVERMAIERGCHLSGSSALLSKMGPVEAYQINCTGSEPLLARCEYQECALLN